MVNCVVSTIAPVLFVRSFALLGADINVIEKFPIENDVSMPIFVPCSATVWLMFVAVKVL